MDHVRSLDWVKEDELPEKTVEVFPWVRPPFPVHKAAFKGILEEVKRLLAAGSDVNQRDADGATPLMHAVAGGREAVCRLLIEHGADLTVRDNEGWTVLKLAKAYPAIVAMLKRAGATE
jgi:ankyrin repeat protein